MNWVSKSFTTILKSKTVRSVVDGERGTRYPVQIVLLRIIACWRCVVYSYKWAGAQASISIFDELVVVAPWNVLTIMVLQQIFGIDSVVVALRDKRIAHFRISIEIRRGMGFLVGEVCCGRLRLRREKIRLQLLRFARFWMDRAW